MTKLSHPYITYGKTIALTRRTFVSKVMSLLFSTLSRLVVTFLPRSTVVLGPTNIKEGPTSNVGSDSSTASPETGVVAAPSLVTKGQTYL